MFPDAPFHWESSVIDHVADLKNSQRTLHHRTFILPLILGFPNYFPCYESPNGEKYDWLFKRRVSLALP
ncbi:hypothetical protein CEXT_116391 [Caerostris extrusa]|uniref:Uncharacterized protein n=1 Tax=Caerostris extrusa TaxID=172846 RepID=A0AAV4VC83_CAEEX|nr:hypothetical protein CEXT_116391 [Caerostris extrusa]